MSSVLDDIKSAFSKTGNGLHQIILINVLVFVFLIVSKVLLTITGFSDIYEQLSSYFFLPASFERLIFKPWTIVTYFFTHESFFHILFNMLFLYWFGLLINEFLGSKRLINLYVLGGIFSGVIYMLVYNFIPYYQEKVAFTSLLGASGGVYAVVIGAAVLLPDYTFFLLLLGPVKIKYIAAFYLLLSFADTIGPNAGGNIAHLGGAIFGFLYIYQLKKGNDLGKPLEQFLQWTQHLFKPKNKVKITYKNTSYKGNSSNQTVTQEEIDTILDKISKYGYEKLSKEEKQKLFKASESSHIR